MTAFKHARVRPGRPASAPRGPPQQLAFAGVAGHAGGAFEGLARLCMPAQLGQEVAAHAGQPVVLASAPRPPARRPGPARPAGRRPCRPPLPGSAPPLARAWPGPARRTAPRCAASRCPRRDGRGRGRPPAPLVARKAERAAQRFGARQRGQPAPDQQRIPAAAVLVHQQYRPALGVGAGGQARGLQLHQRDQAVRLAVAERQLRQDAAQAQRLVA